VTHGSREKESPSISPLPRLVEWDELENSVVAIWDLCPSDSPRVAGECWDHVLVLAESKEEFPPIVVHRPTMRIVDGMHRVRAAVLRGETDIRVKFIDEVNESDLFVLAVKANIAHGLPLSLVDRRMAAKRILTSHPELSNRVVASTTGLSDKTVGALRDSVAQGGQADARVGKDGKRRPLSSVAGRLAASEILHANPQRPLRQVAKDAGVSLGTAHDVRKRLSRGEDPAIPPRGEAQPREPGGSLSEFGRLANDDGRRAGLLDGRRNPAPGGGQHVQQDPGETIRMLMKDPALRYTDSGRVLLRWLSSRRISFAEGVDLVEKVPPHCVITVARYARQVAEVWRQVADQLEQVERAGLDSSERSGPPVRLSA
jgi:ParB-like chromosome segregation protein Spo0J